MESVVGRGLQTMVIAGRGFAQRRLRLFRRIEDSATSVWEACARVRRTASAAVAPATGSSARRNNFDGLRLIAALLVVYGHQGMLSGATDLTGTMGMRVLAFFAISGFLVAGSWHRDPHAGRFIAKRFLRVWPAFAVMVVIGSVVAYVFAPSNLHQLAAMFYLNNLYFYGFDWSFFRGPWPALNQSVWIVPFEVNCYLALALAGLLGKRAVTCCAALALLVSAITYAAASPDAAAIAKGEWESTWTLYFGGFFAAGVLLRQCGWLRSDGAFVGCVVAGCLAFAFGGRTVALLLSIPSAIVWIGLRSWPVLRSAGRFGDFSLGIFLWSWPVQQVTRLWFPSDTSMYLQLAVVLPQVFVLAWASQRFVEVPAARLKPDRSRTGDSTGRARSPRVRSLPLARFGGG